MCYIIILNFEFRFFGSLKRFVRHKACLEGSIVETYVVKECLTFYSMYLQCIEIHFNADEQNNDKANRNFNIGIDELGKGIQAKEKREKKL